MTKRIESPWPDEYPGYLILPDFLTWPQIRDFGNVAHAMRGTPLPQKCEVTIEAVSTIVEWHIDNLPEKPTPADIYKQPDHPALVAGAFYNWILGEVSIIWLNNKTIPKAPAPPPIDTPKAPNKALRPKKS